MQLSLKLYNDKITISDYSKPIPLCKYYDENHKLVFCRNEIKIISCELLPWTYRDSVKRCAMFYSSLSRTHKTINEISDKNEFRYFLTITINQNYVDRFSAVECQKVFRKIIKRLNYRYGAISYLCVGEYHYDHSIHYHMMLNFEICPKVKYRGRSSKGHACYHFVEKFKNKDCFLTLEKLENNNTSYLTKYLTKHSNYPFTRRFMATRGLVRSRLVDIVKFDIGSINLDTSKIKFSARACGFARTFHNCKHSVYTCTVMDTRAFTHVDLSSIYTSAENNNSTPTLSDNFYKFIDYALTQFFESCKNLDNSINLQKWHASMSNFGVQSSIDFTDFDKTTHDTNMYNVAMGV